MKAPWLGGKSGVRRPKFMRAAKRDALLETSGFPKDLANAVKGHAAPKASAKPKIKKATIRPAANGFSIDKMNTDGTMSSSVAQSPEDLGAQMGQSFGG